MKLCYECVQPCYTRLTKLSGRGNLIRATTPLLEQYRNQQRTKSSLEKVFRVIRTIALIIEAILKIQIISNKLYKFP